MAVVGGYRAKRQRRRQWARGSGGVGKRGALGEPAGPTLVSVGTVASLGLGRVWSGDMGSGVSVWIHGRYEVRVGPGFEETILARVVRTLERLG